MKRTVAQISILFLFGGLLFSSDSAGSAAIEPAAPVQAAALDPGKLLREEAGHCAQCPLPRHRQKQRKAVNKALLLAEAP